MLETIEQKKLEVLTMELDLKTMEYKKLCEQLDELKYLVIEPNSTILYELRKRFIKNVEDIADINKQLKSITPKAVN